MVCCNSKYLNENDLMLSYLDQLLVEQIKTSDLDTKSQIYTSEEYNQFPVGLSIYSGSHPPHKMLQKSRIEDKRQQGHLRLLIKNSCNVLGRFMNGKETKWETYNLKVEATH